MDTRKVSNIPEFTKMLQDQRQRMRDAQSRKGQPPPNGPPRGQVIFQFSLGRISNRQRTATQQPGTNFIKSSFVPSPYPPCIQPLAELNKIMMEELLLETHHRGRYMLVRTVTPQDCMTAVRAIVEDENGDVFLLQLYHQDNDTGDILPEETVLILKDPYLKLMSSGDCGLRVDHPSDVVFLSADDERIPGHWRRVSPAKDQSAISLKIKGNDHFKKKEYQSAIDLYTSALGCSPTTEETQMLKLNRSLAFLSIKKFHAALSDAEAVLLSSSRPVEKALFHKSKALYSLQRYRECCDTLKVLRLEYSNNIPAKSQLNRAIERLAEQTDGKYIFQMLYSEASELCPPCLDHATYIGPLKIQPSGSRGRGLFTTAAVKAGDLLLCEKAFTYAYVPEEGGLGVTTVFLDTESNVITMGGHSDLIDMTVRKMYREPRLSSLVTDLHHGSYQPLETIEVDGQPVFDTRFLVRRIISLNCFGCPPSSLDYSRRDRKRVPGQTEKQGFASCGIWPTASYINHSCNSNAHRSFIGDMMIVRATRDLEAGMEITFWYQLPSTDYTKRQGTLLRQWGFSCDCSICLDEKSGGANLRKRKNLAAGLEKAVSPLGPKAAVARITTVINAMEATYDRSAQEVPRLAIWDAMQKPLAKVLHTKQVLPTEKVKLLLRALETLGFVIEGGPSRILVVRKWGLMLGGVVICWMFLRDAYRLVAPELVVPAEGYARAAYRAVFGEDETFESYGDV